MKRSATGQKCTKPFSQLPLTFGTSLSKQYVLIIILLFMATAGFSQAPNISYHTPDVFETDTAITPLTPANTGGTVPNPATVQVITNAQIPKNDNSESYTAHFNVDAAGNIYYCNFVGHNILKFPAGGGTAVPLGLGIAYATGVGLDAAGNVYVLDQGRPGYVDTGKVWEIPVGGGPMVMVGTGLDDPESLALDAAGNIYVSDTRHGAIVKFTPGNTAPVIVASATYLNPQGIALDASGNIYFVNGKNFYEIPAGSGTINLFSRNPTTIAKSVAIDAAGNIYLAEGNPLVGNTDPSEAYLITRIPADGSAIVREGTAPLSYYCTLVAVTPSGNIFTNDVSAGGVYQITQGNYSLSSPLPRGLFLNANSGSISGTPIYAAPAANYVITAHNSAGSSSATVNIKVVSKNASLAKLQLSDGDYEVTPPAGQIIQFDADYTVASIAIIPFAADTSATVKINGGPIIRSGVRSASFPLVVGQNAFTIVVTAPDGITTKTYNVQILRLQSTNDYLGGLALSRGVLYPKPSNLTNTYSASVSSTIASITVTPTTADAVATVTVNGTAVASGTASAAIPLSVGANKITIIVTAQNGRTNTYTITVTRAPSPDTYLATLAISRGVFSPKFSHLITNYMVGVGPSVDSITITPTTLNPNSTITVNGTAVSSGTASQPIPLQAYIDNVVSIVVTAPDGLKLTYIVLVERAPSSDYVLSNLSISAGTLSPAFSPNTFNYTAIVDNSVGAVTVTPTTYNPTSTIHVFGVIVASGEASGPISLAVGNNAIQLSVFARNGNYNIYNITVTRAAASMDAVYEPVSIAQHLETPQLAADGVNVHEGLTPNGDGINDFLVIENITNYPDNKLQILNRNGQLVFEAKNYDNSTKVFDGHSSKTGIKQLPGTYFYSLDYTVKGVAKHKTGFIVLKY